MSELTAIPHETATDRKARQLIRNARTAAPSFVFLNHIMSRLLDLHSSCPEERTALVKCAREILNNER